MTKNIETHILKLSCKDQIGIVANVSSILAKHNCNIVESKQFTDQENGHFFIILRVVYLGHFITNIIIHHY